MSNFFSHIRDNLQLYFILAIWTISGFFTGPVVHGIVALSIILFVRKNLLDYFFLGFFYVLILSDNLDSGLFFAKTFKNVYITALFIVFVVFRKDFVPYNKLFLVFGFFFLFAFFCILFSETYLVSIQKTLSYLFLFIVVPNYFTKIYRDQGVLFLKNVIWFGSAVLLLGLILNFTAYNFSHIETGRFRGFFGNPNGLGLFCLLFFILFYVINWIFPTLFTKRDKILVFSLIIISIILAGSRNAIFSILLFLLLGKFYQISPFLGFAIMLLFVFLYDMFGTYSYRLIESLGLSQFFRLKTMEEGSGRYIAWNFAWKEIQNNFFIGKGFAYNEVYMRRNYPIMTRLGHQGGIHNSFLSFWMDTGLVGLLLYLYSFIAAFLKASFRSPLSFPIMFTIVFSAIFESWLIGSLNPHTIIFLMILTLLWTEDFHTKNVNQTTA